MSTLFQKYAALKKRIPGNRERNGFEYSFGMPREEQQNITPTPRYIVRILSEVEFAIRLSKELDGKYDAMIDEALAYLTDAVDNDGMLTKSVCAKAEEILLPLSSDAKEYKLILAGHAHIDMNWQWGWHETVAATIATFRTMLNIMEEYPDFCFSQSQTSVYKIIDDYAPEMHDEIKARIDEGRWEITASAWVETDKNMPSGDSLMRHIKYTKEYLRDKWGISPDQLEIDFSPDTFGHSANLPEIDAQGGVKYYYHCRGLAENTALYRWRGQSGRELLMYREQYWYNSGITPEPAMGLFDVVRRQAGLKTGLVVYGVGDHGGGPTRRDVERGIEMMDWPIFPTVKFGTFREFFKEAEAVREALPVVEKELNVIFPGCYTTQTRIKRGNRRAELALGEAEAVSACASVSIGAKVRRTAIEAAWQKVLLSHFHDILTGSCVQDAREHAMGEYQNVLATANSEIGLTLGKLSAQIDTSMIPMQKDINAQSEGAGVGYQISTYAGRGLVERGMGLTRIWHVFNNTFADKSEPVEITVWDWTGDMRYLRVTDADDQPLDFQLIDGALQHYWDHKYFRILVWVQANALSYTTVVLSQGEMGEYPVYLYPANERHVPQSNYVLENEHIRCEFDYATGEMLSMIDKADNREYLADGTRATLCYIDTNRHNSNAWEIGTHLKTTPITDVTNIRATMGGCLRSAFSFDAKIANSRVTVEYSLDRGAHAVRAGIKVDWSEVGGETVPVLAYVLPASYRTDGFLYDIPAGTIVRAAAEEDMPGQSMICAVSGGARNLGIITDSKYGFRGVERDGHAVLYSTLINTATSPDPYPERGIHEIVLHIGLLAAKPADAVRTAHSHNRPMTPVSASYHKGTLPPAGTFFRIDAPDAMVSSVTNNDDGSITVRMYSLSDQESCAVLYTQRSPVSAEAVDLFGAAVPGECAVNDDCVTVTLPPRGIVSVKIGF